MFTCTLIYHCYSISKLGLLSQIFWLSYMEHDDNSRVLGAFCGHVNSAFGKLFSISVGTGAGTGSFWGRIGSLHHPTLFFKDLEAFESFLYIVQN